MALAPGTRLGPYEVVAPLGAGGMGEVYRARDPRLGRDVAIKVLPEDLTKDAERRARFEREARVLAALGHSGIASIYGVEDVGGTPALVLELVEGPTLEQCIASGPSPAEEVLPIARQLAEAIEYAHEHGVVHRDLKPANVKLRPDGTVKVLDFGLARALHLEGSTRPGDISNSPTLAPRMTHSGVILGSAAYMAPEQARGQPVDRRADAWAFGCLLFEMLTGRKAFAGLTISDTLASVMRDEPDWSALPPQLSPRWRRLLERCLIKDPRQRLQAIGEARIALEDLAQNPADVAPAQERTAAPSVGRPLRLLPWLVLPLAVVGLALWSHRERPAPASAATELSVVPAGGQKIGVDVAYHPMAISPSGRLLAYTVRNDGRLGLRLRRLDSRTDVELSETDGARNPFFSRDSEWIGFFDSRRMRKVSVRGGTPVDLADSGQDRLGTWLDGGTIVYSPDVGEPLYRIPETGGVPTALTKLDTTRHERTHRYPSALDGGPWVVFTVQGVESPGGYDDASIDAVSVKTGERRHLFKGARRAVWVPGGFLLLARGSDLYAVPVNPNDPRVAQDPVPVLAAVSGEQSSGASFFSVADDGTLAWIPGDEAERTREVGWFDRAGRFTPTSIPVGSYLTLRLSPDGGRALVSAGPGGGDSDLWLADLKTGAMNRLTHGKGSGPAVWLLDGARIAYSRRNPTGGESVVVRRLDGAGGEREIYRASNPLTVTDVTPDGRDVIFCDYGASRSRIYRAPADGAGEAQALPAESDEEAGMVSPDGRWLAHLSNKTGRKEVGLRPLEGGGGSWQVSSGGNEGGIRWGRAGRELFFVSAEALVRVPIEVRGDELSIGQPEKLFDVPPCLTEPTFRDYDYDPASDRFLFTRPPHGAPERREIALSLGWAKKLSAKLRDSAPKP